MFSELLAILIHSLDCQFGYFGYIDEAGDLVCPTLTTDIWDQCAVPEKDIVFRRSEWGGLWGRSLVERRPLIANGGLEPPLGHVPLRNALVVPLLHREKLIGQIALANKPTPFDESDLAFLEMIGRHVSPILHARIQRDRFEVQRQTVEQRLRLLSRITEQVSDSVIATDLEFRIIYANRAFQDLFGYSSEEILGESPEILNADPRAEQIQEEIYRAVASGAEWRGGSWTTGSETAASSAASS